MNRVGSNMNFNFQLLNRVYFKEYLDEANLNWEDSFVSLKAKVRFEKSDFEYYIQTSAVYSSNIEGNSIDIDSYLKNKRFKIKSKPKETSEIDDLVLAYNYAIGNSLSESAFMEAHKILSHTILSL